MKYCLLALFFCSSAFAARVVPSCGGTEAPLLEKWQHSATGNGFDLIVKDEGKYYYVPEDEGLLLSAILHSTWTKDYTAAAKAANYQLQPDNSDAYAACDADNSKQKIVVNRDFSLFKESLMKSLSVYEILSIGPDPNGSIFKKHAARLKGIIGTDEFKKSQQSHTFTLQQWCRIGALLQPKVNMFLQLREVDSASFDGLNSRGEFDKEFHYNDSKAKYSFGRKLGSIVRNLYLPSETKIKSGCSVFEFKVHGDTARSGHEATHTSGSDAH